MNVDDNEENVNKLMCMKGLRYTNWWKIYIDIAIDNNIT